jgi:ribonuclease HI
LLDATNQQAELRAATYALDSLPEGQDVMLYSHSRYVVSGFTEYLPTWRERGWRKLGGGLVANLDLWRRLVAADSGIAMSSSSGFADTSSSVRPAATAGRTRS